MCSNNNKNKIEIVHREAIWVEEKCEHYELPRFWVEATNFETELFLVLKNVSVGTVVWLRC